MIELLKNTNFLIIFFTLFFISTLVFWISIILKFSKKKKLSEADKKELKNIFKNRQFITLEEEILKKLNFKEKEIIAIKWNWFWTISCEKWVEKIIPKICNK